MTPPLRVACLIKQVPMAETLTLDAGGRLTRTGVALEMNPYCRRAVSKGVELARATGGTCTVLTLGPPSAEDALREALAWGADTGIHLCDPALAGSDTLATARALAAALTAAGPFDLILLGRTTVDGETGQVGPELAQLLGLPFASGARVLELAGTTLRLELELDDGSARAEVDLPAVLSAAERLCEPCKVDPEGRAAVDPARMELRGADALGPGPWGEAGSPTVVGQVRLLTRARAGRVLRGPVAQQVAEAVDLIAGRGALDESDALGPAGAAPADGVPPVTSVRPIVVVIEHDRPAVARELLGAAARLAAVIGAEVTALCPAATPVADLAGAGADRVVELLGSRVAEDVAAALIAFIDQHHPWAVLAPSTDFGREVAGRAAAATGSGLIGDAIALEVRQGGLVACKPAFAGALVADITCRSPVQLVTVRPGVLPLPPARHRVANVETRSLEPQGRVRVLTETRNDDVETLARAGVVIGVGTGVHPDEYAQLSPLAALLGAELAATRKVTDKGWAPRARQVGITGRAIAPRLYIAFGLSGKFNHMVGVRAAGTILAVNDDPDAPVFDHCDVGIVADWHAVLPLLEADLRRRNGAG